jgi:hypothetical protein
MSDRVDTEAVRHQLVQAYTRAVEPDVIVHLQAALAEFEDGLTAELFECPMCRRRGFLERIREHDCRG